LNAQEYLTQDTQIWINEFYRRFEIYQNWFPF